MTFADVYSPSYDPSRAIINEMIRTPSQIAEFNRCMEDLPFYRDSGISHDRAVLTAIAVADDDSWFPGDDLSTSMMTDGDIFAMMDEYDL